MPAVGLNSYDLITGGRPTGPDDTTHITIADTAVGLISYDLNR